MTRHDYFRATDRRWRNRPQDSGAEWAALAGAVMLLVVVALWKVFA